MCIRDSTHTVECRAVRSQHAVRPEIQQQTAIRANRVKRQQTAACSQIFRQSRQLCGRTAERQFRVQQALGGLALEHHDRLSGNRFGQVVACVVQHAHGGLPSAEPDGQRFCFAVQRAVLRISAQDVYKRQSLHR